MTTLLKRWLTGHPLACSRDMAIFGGGYLLAILGSTALEYGSLDRLLGILDEPALWLVLATASGTAGLLGLIMPAFLDRVRRHVPLMALAVLGFGVGGLWGLSTNMLAALMLDRGLDLHPPFRVLSAVLFGLVWLPWVVASVLRKPTWPVVLLGTPAVGTVGALVLWLTGIIR